MAAPKYLQQCPTIVSHPASTLRQAAAALKHEASVQRAAGETEKARYAKRLSDAFSRVADGESWQDAFGWAKDAAGKQG